MATKFHGNLYVLVRPADSLVLPSLGFFIVRMIVPEYDPCTGVIYTVLERMMIGRA